MLVESMRNGVDNYGAGGTCPPILGRGTLSRVCHITSGVKSSQVVCLLISRYFISPKHIFYFNADKEASASGGFIPETSYQGSGPWILLGDFHLPESLLCPPNYRDISTPMSMHMCMRMDEDLSRKNRPMK